MGLLLQHRHQHAGLEKAGRHRGMHLPDPQPRHQHPHQPERPGGIRPRPAQPVVLHHNRYARERYREYLEGYEAACLEFRQARGMREKSWQEAVLASTTSLEYMGGREHLREMVTARGFTLD